MKTKTKFLILLIIIALILIGNTLFYEFIGKKQKQLFMQAQETELNIYIDNVLKGQDTKYLKTLRDYAIWDDMVKFISHLDSAWAKDNMDYLMEFFDFDFAKLYKLDGKIHYSAFGENFKHIFSNFSVDSLIFNETKNKCKRIFYISQNDLIIEIFTASIQNSGDFDCKTPSNGYLVAGKIWNKKYILELEKMTNLQVNFKNSLKKLSPKESEIITQITKKLFNEKNVCIAEIVFSKQNPLILDWNKTEKNRFFVTLIISFFLVLIILALLTQWVLFPLREISQTLQNENPKFIQDLKFSKNEFGQLAHLIENFFEQKQKIQESFDEIKRINTQLESASEEIRLQNEDLLQQKEEISAQAEQLLAANEKIQESEEKIQNIFEFLPDAAMVIDKNGVVLAWNKAMENLTNIKKENIIGKGNYEYSLGFYKEKRPILIDLTFLSEDEIKQNYAYLHKEGNILSGETYSEHNGQKTYLMATASPLYNSNSEAIGAIEIVRDITYRKKIEELIEKQNTELIEKSTMLSEANEELRANNDAITQMNEDLTTQRDEIEKQNEKIRKQHEMTIKQQQEITDSIHYARRIQTALLPQNEVLEFLFNEHFILNKPRNIVSGDFYWIRKINNKIIFAVADCTGHGVPGAFMSMLGVAFLNEIVNKYSEIEKIEKNSFNAAKILNELRNKVKTALHQTGKTGESKDGMDIVLCILDSAKMFLQYAGANNPLFLIRENNAEKVLQTETELNFEENLYENVILYEFKPDKMPIGIYINEKESFTNQEIKILRNDKFYTCSDGYEDQFGGEKGRKFLAKNFKQLLANISQQPFVEQNEILDKTFEEWKAQRPQIDDVLVLGVKL